MPHLKTYHRPTTLDDAVELLARGGITAQIIAGGTSSVSCLNEMDIDEVVDLQGVRESWLNEINLDNDYLTIGAMVRLQTIVDDERAPDLVRQMAINEGPNTLRNAASIGGVIAGADPESELLAALLVFDTAVTMQSANGPQSIPLADLLVNKSPSLGGILTKISFPTSGQTSSARVSRTPTDRPIVAALSRSTDDNRTRVAICGIAEIPCLVNPENIDKSFTHQGDFRGSRAYRQQMAEVLVERIMKG